MPKTRIKSVGSPDSSDGSQGHDHDEGNAGAGYASPPCFLHEIDPSYLGYMSRPELVELLDTVLAEEHSVRRCIEEAVAKGLAEGQGQDFDEIAEQSVNICQMVCRLIQDLGRTSTPNGGLARETHSECASTAEALKMIQERKSPIVAKLRAASSRTPDGSLHQDLERIIGSYEEGTA